MNPTASNPQIFSDSRLLALGVVHGTASRHWGNMRDEANKTNFFDSLHINPAAILRLKQTHSSDIIAVLSAEEARQLRAKEAKEADGWILRGNGLGALVLTADCVPLFVWDAKANFVGLAHSGWRGVVQQLPHKLAAEMSKLGAQGPFYAYVGPHIQQCCFEVKEDVEKHFPPRSVLHKNGKTFVDMNWEIKRQLTAAGLLEQDIRFAYQCTCGDKENFFSFRRDHTKDSLLSFIYKP